MSGGQVDIQLPVVQNLINKTDNSQQDQFAAHRAHAARDVDALNSGLGGSVRQAGLSVNQERVDTFNNQVHPFAQQLVDKGNSVVNVSAGAAADAQQAMVTGRFNGVINT